MPDIIEVFGWYVDNNATMLDVSEKFDVSIEEAYSLVGKGENLFDLSGDTEDDTVAIKH